MTFSLDKIIAFDMEICNLHDHLKYKPLDNKEATSVEVNVDLLLFKLSTALSTALRLH